MTINGIEVILKNVYYDPKNPNSFSSANKLYKEAKKINPSITLKDVKNWLSSQFTYTLHKQVVRKFKRNPIIVEVIDQQWEADLVDMQEFAKQNNDYKYIVTVIDCLSKYAWVKPLKNKSAKSVIIAFKEIFNEGRIPVHLRTDKGRDFKNSAFISFLKEYVINFILLVIILLLNAQK